MVTQCANPDCGAPFLYLRNGKVFAIPRRGFSARQAKVEFFWLCGNCAGKLKIESFRDGFFATVEDRTSCDPLAKVG